MHQPLRFLVAVVCLLASHAWAQWQWLDSQGRPVFSDRPPPADILEKNILQRPATPAKTTAALPPAVAGSGAASVIKPAGVDKELTERKKRAEETEAAKRREEEERILKVRAENCARARQARANLDSGMRIARVNEKGEREVLDDATRAAEITRLQSIVDADCR